MSKILLLGGPPGVSKTSALKILPSYLPKCAIFDADDVWRTYPRDKDPTNRARNIKVVNKVIQCHLESKHTPLVFAWVLANPLLVAEIIEGSAYKVDSIQRLYLVADAGELKKRLEARSETTEIIEFALGKLDEINQLNQAKLDTTYLSQKEVAEFIAGSVNS
jgi:hypothetical protein